MRGIFKIIAALAVVVLLAFAVMGAARLILSTVNIISTGGGDVQTDPMFAEEAVTVTRPPELLEETGTVFQDNSANWEIGEENPVTMTAEELASEEENLPDAP